MLAFSLWALTFRWRHQSCNLGSKPVIFSFPLCSSSFISNVSSTREAVAVQTACLGLWLYCQRAASLHDVKWQLLCVCFVFTSLPASPLRSASLDSVLRLPGCCSAVIYLVPCRNLLTLLLQTPLHTYLSRNSSPPQITNRAHFLVGAVLTFCWSLPKFLVSCFQYFPRWREHFIIFCFSCSPFAICTQYQEEP